MDKEKLLNALGVVRPGLSSREIVEQSTHFAFLKGRVATYNDEISISHPLPDFGLEGAIRAEELYQLLAKLPNKELSIERQGNELMLVSGRTKAGFTLQEKIEMPLHEVGEDRDWKPFPKEVIDDWRFTMFSASKDMSKPVLTCVHVRDDGYLESSDDIRITRKKSRKLGLDTFLIPAASISDLSTYDMSEISSGHGWIHFRNKEGTEFSSRILSKGFPDVSQYLELEGSEITFPRTLDSVLDRAMIFSKARHELDYEVEVTLHSGRMTLRSEGEDTWFEEEVNNRYKGDPVTFLVNPHLLKEITANVKRVVLGPSTMKFEGKDWEHLVMLAADMGSGEK